ncbi:MAG: hypothetical protein R3D70_24025 [Rhizobiaceae bacterium]
MSIPQCSRLLGVYAGHLHRLVRPTKAEMAGHVPEVLPGRAPTRSREDA